MGIINTIRKQLQGLKKSISFSKKRYQKLSYSQCGEDLIIDFIFERLSISNPTYIDIGAHHPFYLSNTAFFHKKGCNGINIEPDPVLFKQFPKHRKKDVNLNCGVGDQEMDMDLYVMDVPALNTYSADEANRLVKEHGFKIVNKITTPVHTLNTIINKYNNGVFPDLLSLDVEGIDEAIIRSIDFKRSAPIIICVETVTYSDSGNGIKDVAIADYLKTQGYMVYADTNINTIFVLQHKWQK